MDRNAAIMRLAICARTANFFQKPCCITAGGSVAGAGAGLSSPSVDRRTSSSMPFSDSCSPSAAFLALPFRWRSSTMSARAGRTATPPVVVAARRETLPV